MTTKKAKSPKKYFLIDLLESFSISELERFTHFVASTYFNTDQWAVQLLSTLNQSIIGKVPYDDSAQIKVYKSTFSEKLGIEFLNEKQRKLLSVKMSVLTKLAKRFLAIEALEETPACKKELVNKRLLEKKQFRLFAQLHKKNQQYLVKKQIRGLDYYEFAYQIEADSLNYQYQTGSILKEDNFSELISSLDIRYLLNKLQFQTIMLSIKNTTKKEYDFTPFESISTLLTLPKYSNHPLIIVYRTVIQLIEIKKETIYFHLLKILDLYQFEIPKNNLMDFYGIAGNFCVHQIRLGKVNYNQELFDLYENMDKKNLLLEGQFMQAVKLKNIVTMACKVSEFDWAVKAIHYYSTFINKAIQKSVYHFNLGIIAFYQQQYKEAISHLIRVEKVNLAYDLDSRLLLLQAYYLMDTDYDERTMQIFRSTAHFVYTHKTMPSTHKKSYKNFLQMLISLYQVRHRVGRKTLAGIRTKLSNIQVILARQWLLDRMEEISKEI